MEKQISACGLLLATFTSPLRALREAAESRRCLLPILVATALSGAFAVVAIPRIDFATTIAENLDASPAAAKMTPHERKKAIETGSKVGAIAAVVGGIAGPAAMILAAALFLWIGFKVAGGKPGFVPSLAVVGHGMLPLSLKSLLSIPALLRRQALPADALGGLLPSSLAALAPDAATSRLALLSAFDLFSLWSLVLVALGMAHVARVSKVRSAVTTLVLWGGYVALFHVALPSIGAAS